jgi:hypothetical protein
MSSLREVWSQFAAEVGGQLMEAGSGAPLDFVSIPGGDGELQLCAIGASLAAGRPAAGRTLMRIDLRRSDDFRFAVRSSTPIDALGRLFGAQDIEVGDLAFDRAHVVKGSDELRVRLLLGSSEIRSALHGLRASEFALTGSRGLFGSRLPEGCGELHFYNARILDQLAALHSLYRLFGLTLEQLRAMGCIAGARTDRRVVQATADQQNGGTEVERWIREHATEVGREEFPDNPQVVWSVKGFRHSADLVLAEVVPDPDEVGYPRFVFGFAGGSARPRHVATWCFRDGGYTLLCTGPGAPRNLARQL